MNLPRPSSANLTPRISGLAPGSSPPLQRPSLQESPTSALPLGCWVQLGRPLGHQPPQRRSFHGAEMMKAAHPVDAPWLRALNDMHSGW